MVPPTSRLRSVARQRGPLRPTAFDGLVHGWDLSRATGLPYEPPDDLVAEVDAFARQFVQPEMRDGDTFAAETEAAEAIPEETTPEEATPAETTPEETPAQEGEGQ